MDLMWHHLESRSSPDPNGDCTTVPCVASSGVWDPLGLDVSGQGTFIISGDDDGMF